MNETMPDEADTLASPGGASRGSRVRIGLLLVALVVVGGWFSTYQLQLFDPYRPGTTHAVQVTRLCADLPPIHLGGRTWVPVSGQEAGLWFDLPDNTSVSVTLRVTARDQADVLFAFGLTARYRQLPPRVFYAGACAIR